ncbi:MAG: hypothetical protein K2N21_00875 [Rikenellaceae bacterium]|nr:hypothetical protein [Rikenellaceae bacterium]
MADTVTSAPICDIIQAKSLERLKGMEPDKASSYNVFQDSPFEVYPILDTRFGLIVCGAYKGYEEYDYWFFNDTDYTFVAQTDSPLCNYLSKNGYMATHKIYHHDSCTDIFVYRLHDGSMELVYKFAEIETSSLNKALWGADALYISCKQIHYPNKPPPMQSLH